MARQLDVGPKMRPKTLIFDLDETLIRAKFEKPPFEPDQVFKLKDG